MYLNNDLIKPMKKLSLAIIILAALLLSACTSSNKTESSAGSPTNGIYYWKTTFELDDAERSFLTEHNIGKLYLRLFDVVPAGNDMLYGFDFQVVPNATITFHEPIPQNVEIIPVVYITIDALRLITNSNHEYAQLIVERVLNMVDFNDLGTIREVQLDCDWTQQTQDGYFAFCQAVKNELAQHDIQLGCTIRLWQLACACPPVDRGVLMLYNTGNITNPNTNNSILDLKDVKSYLKGNNYNLPLDFAYPIYSWYVWFRNDAFLGLFHEKPADSLIKDCDVVRYENADFNTIMSLDSLVHQYLPTDNSSIILYHLDSDNLSNYSTNEIHQIYSND